MLATSSCWQTFSHLIQVYGWMKHSRWFKPVSKVSIHFSCGIWVGSCASCQVQIPTVDLTLFNRRSTTEIVCLRTLMCDSIGCQYRRCFSWRKSLQEAYVSKNWMKSSFGWSQRSFTWRLTIRRSLIDEWPVETKETTDFTALSSFALSMNVAALDQWNCAWRMNHGLRFGALGSWDEQCCGVPTWKISLRIASHRLNRYCFFLSLYWL